MKNTNNAIAIKENPSKEFNSKFPISISLCLGKFMDGLHVDLNVIKEGKDKGSSATVSLNGEPIAFYDMDWTERIHPEDGLFDAHAEILNQILSE